MPNPLYELDQIFQKGYHELRRRRPGLDDRGGCVLLGKHYAHPESKIVFLGLNPGGEVPPKKLDCTRQRFNWLLDEEAPNTGGPNWTNARKFFASSPTLRSVFATGTFSFCCPYRTEDWTKSLSDEDRGILTSLSRPVLRRILADCQPRLVVVTGTAAYRTFEEMIREDWQITKFLSRAGKSGDIYQWAAFRGLLNGQEATLAQVPHFSRANSSVQLHECAQWLSAIATSVAATA